MVDIRKNNVWKKSYRSKSSYCGILWLNEKDMEEGLDNKKFQQFATKYNSNHRKHRY